MTSMVGVGTFPPQSSSPQKQSRPNLLRLSQPASLPQPQPQPQPLLSRGGYALYLSFPPSERWRNSANGSGAAAERG
ncbi:uncharacterized protein LY89DRAFT_680098 [Mollisia scopiformis]|uniref:Uncharacterized protein n=1 Tax=Mollisia scopiformis TaxID=149040 RepID=A0A194XT55_MOLSC|nr:uncharacterized protein LY89DRAFT_680098 [Mollisia scopiformis]KUJ23331.1 hypothetical protein LY89DRAFT_680098 [Mollisia scopiformis]